MGRKSCAGNRGPRVALWSCADLSAQETIDLPVMRRAGVRSRRAGAMNRLVLSSGNGSPRGSAVSLFRRLWIGNHPVTWGGDSPSGSLPRSMESGFARGDDRRGEGGGWKRGVEMTNRVCRSRGKCSQTVPCKRRGSFSPGEKLINSPPLAVLTILNTSSGYLP